MAGLRDSFSDMDFNMDQCMKTIGNPSNMKILVNGVIGMEEKTSALVSSNEKMGAEIELLKDQVDVLNNKVVELSEQLPE